MRTLLICLFFISIPFFYKKIPNRFKLPPSLPRLVYNPDWEISKQSLSEKDQIQKILSQSFSYLSCGHQSYVFESEDKQYVIKLFRYRCSLFEWIEKIKAWIDSFYKERPKDTFFVKVDKTFRAARIAYEEGKEYTEVVYCHLNLTRDEFPIVSFKKGSHTYSVPLDRYRFVIQKKIDPFKQTLLHAKCDPAQMHLLIDSFIHLLLERSSKGIRNSDPNLGPNFGFYQGRAVEMDFGNYRKVVDSCLLQKEIDNFIARFKDWLRKNGPEYISYVDAKYLEMKEFRERQKEEARS